jgi:predicted permease
MRQLRAWFLRLAGLFNKDQRDHELASELEFHLQMHIEDNLRSGMNPEEARRLALIRLGGIESTKENYRNRRGLPALETLLQDVRYSLRMLGKSPGFTAVAVITLALGIGVNTGVFTVINGLLLRARVDKDPGSFIHLSPQYSGQAKEFGQPGAISLSDFRSFQAGTHTLSDLAAWAITRVKLGEGFDKELALLVTRNFFSVYGLEQPKLGRLFLADECSTSGAAAVVILSEEIWRNRFGADPQIIGSVINLNRHPFTVVGIVPAHFSGRLRGMGIWIPYTMQPQVSLWDRNLFQEIGTPWLMVDGRIKSGQSHSAVQAELEVMAKQQDRLQPGRTTRMILTNGSMIEEPALRAKVFWVSPLIMGALSLVLIITCVNVTVLMLSRAAVRQREVAIRLALGVGRGRLLRMLLTESLILAGAAGVISAYLAYQVPKIFERTFAEAPNYPLQPDWRVFAYLTAVTMLAGCIAGWAPALESLKVNLLASLKGCESVFGAGTTRWRAGDVLIAAQVAMSVVLLATAGLFMRAQYTMINADPGFESKQVLLVPLEMELPHFPAGSATSFYRTLERRVRAMPGVQAACYASSPPGSSGEEAAMEEVRLPDQPKGTEKPVALNSVSPDFFETFRIPIIAGRTFLESDAPSQSTAPVIVASETFARTFWPGDDALGKVIEDSRGSRLRVVGVARDTKSMFGALDNLRFYYLWKPQTSGYSLMVRFVGDARPAAKAVRNVIRDLDHEMTAYPRTLRSLMDEVVARFWVVARMILFLGVVALVLAVIGVYGVVAFTVSRRTKEMGIRLALGATPGQIFRLVLESGAKPILAGLVGGLILAMVGAEAMVRVLREIPVPLEAWDPLAYLAISTALSGSAMTALLGLAQRAKKVDPMVALRYE